MKNTKIAARAICLAIAAIVLVIILCLFTGCNQTVFDTVYKFDRAIIEMPGGEVIEVEIQQWGDYDGEQLQIIAKDGTVYLVSSNNCVLIRDK
jgi:hypothetical protein